MFSGPRGISWSPREYLAVGFRGVSRCIRGFRRVSEGLLGASGFLRAPRKFVYANGKAVDVQMCVAGTRYVRVFDLPPEPNDDLVSSVLGQFGKVDRIVREKFSTDSGLGNIENGVHGVYKMIDHLRLLLESGRQRYSTVD